MVKQTKNQDTDRPVYSCEGCKKQISASTALTFEAADYIWHFCSQPCYDKWQAEKSANKED
jgi:hypothetical protein